MMRFFTLLLSGVIASLSMACAVVVEGTGYSATFERHALIRFEDASGRIMVRVADTVDGGALHCEEGVFPVASDDPAGGLSGFSGGSMHMSVLPDAELSGLRIRQWAEASEGGINGVEWTVERVPLSYNIIVPAHSGLRLRRDTPGERFSFDYPMIWEAQLVLVEGDNYGFIVWAEDVAGRYKRLTIDRDENGWRLGFITHPNAPFEDNVRCESVVWRVTPYEGDWRAAARIYRDWMRCHFQPVPIGQQKPAWVADIRGCIIVGLDREQLEPLSRKLDPTQTLLYVYDWRAQGYDRMYPDYDQPHVEFESFMGEAHRLGFRVMLHVNYFGCHPEHPLYERFAPFHCRVPHGARGLDWWFWGQAEPPIKFAYINPASQAWRMELISRLETLCRRYSVDALHLDQTLVMYNDYNGLVDGMTMIGGNLALHRELREALPEVALSGEGLNEITYRFEAFAQRHVYGINHTDNTFNPEQIDMAHPICAYLFGDNTRVYGYLGMASPATGTLYAAWNKAYRRWGTLPTLKPHGVSLTQPEGFTRQFFDEAGFWMSQRLLPDMEGVWPEGIAFPMRTGGGEPVRYTEDQRLVMGTTDILQVISGASTVALPGVIPGWRGYNRTHLIGLDPGESYAYVSGERDYGIPHVTAMPDGYVLAGLLETRDMLVTRFRSSGETDIHIARLLKDAICGTRLTHGVSVEQRGALESSDGAHFLAYGDTLHAHPPWATPGSGEVFARMRLELPTTATRFFSQVALDYGAVGEGRSDGVEFGVIMRHGDQELRNAVLQTEARPGILELGVDVFAGQEVSLELWVGPGPASNPGFDWARWHQAKIECRAACEAPVSLAGLSGWEQVLTQEGSMHLNGKENLVVSARLPGSLFLLRELPELVVAPLNLIDHPFIDMYRLESGLTQDAPLHACARLECNQVGGVERQGFFAHPPNAGQTLMHFPVRLGTEPVALVTHAGLRDGASPSEGVIFQIEVNGAVKAEKHVRAGAWHTLSADLSAWKECNVIVTLVTDADGDYNHDWACWGDPIIETVRQ